MVFMGAFEEAMEPMSEKSGEPGLNSGSGWEAWSDADPWLDPCDGGGAGVGVGAAKRGGNPLSDAWVSTIEGDGPPPIPRP